MFFPNFSSIIMNSRPRCFCPLGVFELSLQKTFDPNNEKINVRSYCAPCGSCHICQ